MPETSSIRPVVQIQYRLVTDGRTDRQTHDDSIIKFIAYRVSTASRGNGGKNTSFESMS